MIRKYRFCGTTHTNAHPCVTISVLSKRKVFTTFSVVATFVTLLSTQWFVIRSTEESQIITMRALLISTCCIEILGIGSRSYSSRSCSWECLHGSHFISFKTGMGRESGFFSTTNAYSAVAGDSDREVITSCGVVAKLIALASC